MPYVSNTGYFVTMDEDVLFFIPIIYNFKQ